MGIRRQQIYDNLPITAKGFLGDRSYKTFCRETFWGPGGDSIRLKNNGLTYLKEYYTIHTVEVLGKLEKDNMPSKHFVYLSKYCKFPYYIGTNRVMFLNEEEAFIFKMVDGDIDNVKDISD